MAPSRVLITGVANFWGTRLAARLVAEGVDVIGLDTRVPEPGLAGLIEFVETDLRSPELLRIVRATRADAVVHNDINQFPAPGRSPRVLHDTNVVGTLQLIAACELLDGLHTFVVRGSAAIYGSEASAPSFFTEDMARRYPLRTRFQRDIGELERLLDTFTKRHPEVACTMLRLQPVIGTELDTPITRLFRLPVVPTMLGFDPRVQFLHEDDSIEVLAAATLRPVRGPVNVAAAGTVSLSRALRRLGRVSLPIPHPLFGAGAGMVARVGRVNISEDMARYLRYGRGVDTTRLTEELGVAPRSTLETIDAVAAGGTAAGVAA